MMNAMQGVKTAGWGKSNNVVISTILFVMILVWVPILISPDADTGIVTDTSVSIDAYLFVIILVSVPILVSVSAPITIP